MKRKITIGIAALVLIGAIIAVGAVAAYGNPWKDRNVLPDHDDDGIPNGLDENYERPRDCRNSPWILGDERLERLQEQFDLTDDQIAAIQEKVTLLIDEEAAPAEIMETIEEMLKEFGVENPELMGQGPHGMHRQGYQGHGRGSCPYNDE